MRCCAQQRVNFRGLGTRMQSESKQLPPRSTNADLLTRLPRSPVRTRGNREVGEPRASADSVPVRMSIGSVHSHTESQPVAQQAAQSEAEGNAGQTIWNPEFTAGPPASPPPHQIRAAGRHQSGSTGRLRNLRVDRIPVVGKVSVTGPGVRSGRAIVPSCRAWHPARARSSVRWAEWAGRSGRALRAAGHPCR